MTEQTYLAELIAEQRYRLEVTDTLAVEPRLNFLCLGVGVRSVSENIVGFDHR